MIGIIPKILVDLIKRSAGDEQLSEIFKLADIPLDRAYDIHKPYADSEWQQLFNNTLKVMALSKEQAYTLYADAFVNYVLELFPSWFEMAKNSKELLLLQPVIHNGFASSVIDAEKRKTVEDKFRISENADNELIVHYNSPNRLCGLYVALAKRVAEHYQDKIDVRETSCLLEGDDCCTLAVSWQHIEQQA